MTPEERSKTGRRSRRKGQNFERLIANSLKDLWPEAKRGLQSRGGTKEAPDVDGCPFFVECKIGLNTKPKDAIEQARNASDGRTPIAITRDNSGPILVTMDFEEFKRLHHAIRKAEQQVEELRTTISQQYAEPAEMPIGLYSLELLPPSKL